MSEIAYTKFLKFVILHANPYKPRSYWQEVIGFLFGRFPSEEDDDYEVHITDVLPMDFGSSVYVKIGDYSPVFPIISEKMEKNEFIVGWIHSHPGLGIFLSGTDVNTQSIYQNVDKRSVAIVVDQTKIKKNFSGMKCFRIDAKNNFDALPLIIEDVQDFSVVYEQIIKDLLPDLKIMIPLFSNEKIVQIRDIKLNLKAPNKWNFDDDMNVPIYFYYESEEEGFVIINYKIEVQGGTLFLNNQNYKKHRIYNTGLLAHYQIKPIENYKNVESITVKIEQLIITNRDKNKIKANPIELVIKNSK